MSHRPPPVLLLLCACALTACYESHVPRPPADATDGGGDAHVEPRPDAGPGLEGCPTRSIELGVESRPLLAFSPEDATVTVVETGLGGAPWLGETRWQLTDGALAIEPLGVDSVYGWPTRLGGRTWMFAARDFELLFLSATPGDVRARPTVFAQTRRPWPEGRAVLRWLRTGENEHSLIRSDESRDETFEVTGDDALLSATRNGVEVRPFVVRDEVLALSFSHAGPSWVARLELEGDRAELLDVASFPAVTNPYRAKTSVLAGDRLYTAASSAATEVVIRELDDHLVELRRETLTIGSTTGSCALQARGTRVAMFCSVGASGRLFVYHPFAGEPGQNVSYLTAAMDAPRSVSDIVWVAEDRALIASTSLETSLAALSLVCLP